MQLRSCIALEWSRRGQVWAVWVVPETPSPCTEISSRSFTWLMYLFRTSNTKCSHCAIGDGNIFPFKPSKLRKWVRLLGCGHTPVVLLFRWLLYGDYKTILTLLSNYTHPEGSLSLLFTVLKLISPFMQRYFSLWNVSSMPLEINVLCTLFCLPAVPAVSVW